MQIASPTTPFGRRPFSLALLAGQLATNDLPSGSGIRKWDVYDDIKNAKAAIGLSDRTVTVLYALLTFHPADTLPADKPLIVFPSNRTLAARAGGMAENTLRRHLARLVSLAIIVRRDSPNGKRYARKGEGGEIDEAFGFDLSPLIARAAEFKRLAAEAAAEQRIIRQLRERITIHRRDIDKMIATGIYEGVPGNWNAYQAAFKSLGGRIPRTATRATLEPLARELESLAADIRQVLETHVKDTNKTTKMSGNATQDERHIQNSNPNPIFDFEHGLPRRHGPDSADHPQPHTPAAAHKPAQYGQYSYPLGMVLDACPDIAEHAPDGIKSWRDLITTAELVRPWLGISPSAWEDATEAFGLNDAAVVVAAILQRSSTIKSAGGYLRSLTGKARAGAFSLGPVLMALIRANLRSRAGKRSA
jgi:replication initiation protein RepC